MDVSRPIVKLWSSVSACWSSIKIKTRFDSNTSTAFSNCFFQSIGLASAPALGPLRALGLNETAIRPGPLLTNVVVLNFLINALTDQLAHRDGLAEEFKRPLLRYFSRRRFVANGQQCGHRRASSEENWRLLQIRFARFHPTGQAKKVKSATRSTQDELEFVDLSKNLK